MRSAWACLLSAGLVGCGPSEGEAPAGQAMLATTGGDPLASRPSPEVATEGGTLDAVSPFRPGPSRGRGDHAVALNRDCETCHEEEAAEWRGSHHQRAHDNPAYRAAFAIEPLPFCRGCHAPEGNPLAPPTAAVGALGVGCVTCHVTPEGAVLATAHDRTDGLERDGSAPHAVLYSADFAHTGGCASCHEFSFPGPGGTGDEHFMQTTVREHARSPAADRGCAECHMPLTGGRRSHAFDEVRDPEWLRGRLDVDARVTEVGALVVKLVQRDPGHGFPTGDLFRRLEVGAELRGSSGEPLMRAVRHLARHFEQRPGHSGRQLVRDDRVFDAPREVELDVACETASGERGVEIAWWVTFQRVAQVLDGLRPLDAEIESEVPLYSGRVRCASIPSEKASR